ncbi:MAG: Uma2 family endonuclease [Synechococcales cyanobacterium RM1_1_8]|nr:Uma2 family endonuclease [Synechococcales cyanobacterium RM1_1_8]
MVGLAPPRPSSSLPNPGVVLQGISWETYLKMLSEMGEHRACRLAYRQGRLEITMPSDLHEGNKKLLERMLEALTEELEQPLKSFGSTTLNREDLRQGAEPDSCYYIQNANQIVGRRIDLERDPPPDLVLEVDISSPSTQRMEIYAQLGVAELWRYIQGEVQILQLENGRFVACDSSPTFPIVSAAVLNEFLQVAEMQDETAWIRSWRRWIREQLAE